MNRYDKASLPEALGVLNRVPEFLPVKNIFQTFDRVILDPAEMKTRTGDWNPLEQVLKIAPQRTPRFRSSVLRNYEKNARLGFQVGEIIHESIHLALWEIFFTGQASPKSLAEFMKWSLIFEAFAFWYCDFYVVPLLQKVLSKRGPPIFLRSTPSFAQLNPLDIWIKEFGPSSDGYLQALTFYWRSLSGTLRLTKTTSKGLAHVSQRLDAVGQGAFRILPAIYLQYKRCGIFDSYFEAYCVPYNDRTLSLLSGSMDPTLEGTLRFLTHQLPQIAKRPNEELFGIQRRRKMQRFCLTQALKCKNTQGRSLKLTNWD
ncbi:MAG: hypothetical protein K2X47_14930 [Bdellovibrionales bacterium]|nr:hypothetical protein [Bdellovibrionales bacterium]